MKQWILATRLRFTVAVIVAMVALPAAAIAAWVIYSGVGGSAQGGFDTTTSSNSALVFSLNGTPPVLDPGATIQLPLKVTNADPNAAHTFSTSANPVATFTSTPSDCAAHLTAGNYSVSLPGKQVPAGGSFTLTMPVTADGSLPSDCVGGTYTAVFSGTTNP